MNLKIRPPAVAGSFYPNNPYQLKHLIQSLWPKDVTPTQPKALIIPHAGLIYSGAVAAAAYALIDPNRTNHIILIGPSHHFTFTGLSQDIHTHWQTPLGQVPIKSIKPNPPYLFNNSTHHIPEHSLEVQLPFLQYHLKTNFTITPLLISTPSHLDQLTQIIIQNLTFNTLVIISSDLSHYYPLPIAQQKDQLTIQTILDLDIDTLLSHPDIEACGKYAIALLLKIALTQGFKPQLIAYDTSATASGDTTHVVGYTAIAFYQ